MSDKKNTTVHDALVNYMKKASWKIDSEELYGKSSLGQLTYKDDHLSERNTNLLERFPSKDIGDIRKLEKTLDTFDSPSIDMEEILELCLKNDIVPSEILLMDVLFKNNLKTALRNGITVLNIDGSLEIRNGSEKFLSPQETDLIRAYLSSDDDNMPSGFQGGVDPATSSDLNFGSLKTKTAQGVKGDIGSVSSDLDNKTEVTVEGEYVVSH
jgi:hypothetical protein